MNKTLIVILLIATFFSCDEFHHDLGSGLAISYDESKTMNGRSAFTITDTSTYTLIDAWVLSLDYDRDFVIVQQKPWNILWTDSLIKIYDLKEMDLRIDTSSLRQYWIINKSEERVYNEEKDTYSGVYGPFTKDSFNIIRVELGVADSLYFQRVESCKRYIQYGLD